MDAGVSLVLTIDQVASPAIIATPTATAEKANSNALADRPTLYRVSEAAETFDPLISGQPIGSICKGLRGSMQFGFDAHGIVLRNLGYDLAIEGLRNKHGLSSALWAK